MNWAKSEKILKTICFILIGILALMFLCSLVDSVAAKETKLAVPPTIYDKSFETLNEPTEEYHPNIDECMFIDSDINKVYYTEDDVILLATITYLEAGIENDDSQRGVASVIINRSVIEHKTLEEVIYAPNQFTPAHKIPYTTPSKRCIDNARYVLENGTTLPKYVTYFRADYYFNWGNRYKQYTHYDNTYFSYDVELYNGYN